MFLVALLLGAWTTILLFVGTCFFLGGFMFYFFRDPDREIPSGDDFILSPADGRVLEITHVQGEGYGEGQVIRIFLAPWDVHIQRVPVAGRVVDVQYRPGAFLDARDPRSALINEANDVMIESSYGRVLVRQIAGFLARRIVCWVEPGEMLEAGERFGLIRLGSQTDLFLPSNVKLDVERDDRVVAGETVIGRWPVSQKVTEEKESVKVEV